MTKSFSQTKTIYLLIALLILSAFGLLTSARSANAQEPIPDISETKDYIQFRDYVRNTLYVKQAEPTTEQGKNDYRKTLDLKAEKTYKRAEDLIAQRRNRNQKQTGNKIRRATNNIRAGLQRKIGAINKQYYANLNDDERSYQRAVSEINSSYAPLLNTYLKQLNLLAKKYQRVKDPNIKLEIKESIETLKLKRKRVKNERQVRLDTVKKQTNREDRRDSDVRRKKVASAINQASEKITKNRIRFKREHLEKREVINKISRFYVEVITTIKARGNRYIDAMPVT
jgi:hypothetical protein